MIQNINYCDKNKEKQIKLVCMCLNCKENSLICCLECAKEDHEDHLEQLNETNTFKQKLIQSREDCNRYVSTLRSQMEKILNSFEQFCARILERYSIEDQQFFCLKNEEIGQLIKILDSFKGFKEKLMANNIFESFNDKIDQYQQDKIDYHQQDKQENYGDISSVQQQNKTEPFILDNYLQQKCTGFSFLNEILQTNPQRTQLLVKDNEFNHFLFDHSQQIAQIKMIQQFMQSYNKTQQLSKERWEKINQLQFEQVLLNKQMENMNQKSKEEINQLQFEQEQLNKQMENMKQKQKVEINQLLTKQEQLKKQMKNANQESKNVRTQYYKLYDEKIKIQTDYIRLSKEYEQKLEQNYNLVLQQKE